MDKLARLRAKRALVEEKCELYKPRDRKELPIAPRHCQWRAHTAWSGRTRQCSRYAQTHFGGFGFCWQHAGKVVVKTELNTDEADGLPVRSL